MIDTTRWYVTGKLPYGKSWLARYLLLKAVKEGKKIVVLDTKEVKGYAKDN
jgi:hypothetical protein